MDSYPPCSALTPFPLAPPRPAAAAGTDVAEAKGRVVLMVLGVLFKLSLAVAAALAVAKTLLPPALKLMQRRVSRLGRGGGAAGAADGCVRLELS